jgi:hypothetical protein
MDMEILSTKSNLLKAAFGLFMLMVLSACEREAMVKLPEVDPRPVLTCFISPDDEYILVKLNYSFPLYRNNRNDKSGKAISDAVVRISGENASTIIPFVNDSIGYRLASSQFPVLPGKKYKLTVELSDGQLLSAETTVPELTFPSLEYNIVPEMVDSGDFGVSYEIAYELRFQDYVGVENFYRILVYNLFSDLGTVNDTLAQLFNSTLITDAGKDGEMQSIKGVSYYFDMSNTPIINNYNMMIYAIHANRDYYLYHRDLETNFDSPFSEPRINYSNVNGAIGCFGAFRMTRLRI